MMIRNIGIIIRREYLNRVKKKSFLILTFAVPVLFAALCILPTVIMTLAKEETKKIAVVDESGLVVPDLENTETIEYIDMSTSCYDSLKAGFTELGLDALLHISPLDSNAKTVSAVIHSSQPLGMDMTRTINDKINNSIREYRINTSGIDGLAEAINNLEPNVKLISYTFDKEGNENVSESGVYMMVSFLLGIVIYMFITLFGAMVMSSVIEEKSSRVVEVLISSVRATDLMFGKIIGIALVALTQFMLWIVLTFAIVGVAGAAFGTDLLSGAADTGEMAQMAGVPAEQTDIAIIFSTLRNLPIMQFVICFIVYFIFGYMLYASLFAAIGSASESEGDSQQLQLPVTIPLMIGFFISIYAYKAPDSAVVFWGSMIPFTSPIVMLARLPFGVPVWEIVLSFAILVLCFMLCAWLSAKIYRVGILMFGKKSTWKDLWKWLKQD